MTHDAIVPTIDPEFQALLWPLPDEDRTTLAKSILADGCRDALVVWQGILLDGHNRLMICKAHGLGYRVVEVDLPDREAAMDWIDANQLGRRNLTKEQASLVRGRLYNRSKKVRGGTGANQHTAQRGQNDPQPKTAESIGSRHGVSASTVKRDGRFAKAVELLKKAFPDLVGQQFPKKRVIEAAKRLDEPDKARAILTGKPEKKKLPTDKPGQPISGAIAEAFARAGEIGEIVTTLTKLKARVKEARKSEDPLFAAMNFNDVIALLNNARTAFKSVAPYAICPYCAGDGCRACGTRGWVGKFVYDRAPSEMKAVHE